MEIRGVIQFLSEFFAFLKFGRRRLKMMLFQSKIVVAPNLDRK